MHQPRIDITDHIFGQWVVVRYVGKKYWECVCSCGKIVNVDGSKLRAGKTRRCQSCSHRRYPLGDYGSRLYVIWNNMKQRCYNKNNPAYCWYGERGVGICLEWLDSFSEFKRWAIDSFYNESLTIDRRDNDGDYEPYNCRWVSLQENILKSHVERKTHSFTLEKNIIFNKNANKYDLIINKKYLGRYFTVEAAKIDRDWYANRELKRIKERG